MTTLDTSNRIARYTWHELLEPLRERAPEFVTIFSNRVLAASVPAVLGVGLAWSGGYEILWPAFGGANQMLASVALLTTAAWVVRVQKSASWPVLVPAVLLWITVTAALLWYLAVAVPARWEHSPLQAAVIGVLMVTMLVLNGMLAVTFGRQVRGKPV